MIKNSPLIMAAGWAVLCLAVVLGSASIVTTFAEVPFAVPVPGGWAAAGRVLPPASLVVWAVAGLLLFVGAGHARGLELQRPWAELIFFQPLVLGFIWLVMPATGPGLRDWVIGAILASAAMVLLWKSPRFPRPNLSLLHSNRHFLLADAALILSPLVLGLILGIRPHSQVLLLSLASYPLYAIVQLTVFLAIPASRLSMIRLPARGISITLAVVFMLAHWPNPLVMAATGLSMVIWSRQYLQGRSLFQLALVMGLAATTFSQFLPDTATSHMRVGPGYVRTETVQQLSLPGEHSVAAGEFLTALYPRVLARESTATELAHWETTIDQALRTTRPWQFFTSGEYAARAWGTDLPAAPPAAIHWLNLDEDWQKRIRSFGEPAYWQKHGSTWPGFMAALYRDILGREASALEISSWQTGLTWGQRKRLAEVMIENYPTWKDDPVTELTSEGLRLPN